MHKSAFLFAILTSICAPFAASCSKIALLMTLIWYRLRICAAALLRKKSNLGASSSTALRSGKNVARDVQMTSAGLKPAGGVYLLWMEQSRTKWWIASRCLQSVCIVPCATRSTEAAAYRYSVALLWWRLARAASNACCKESLVHVAAALAPSSSHNDHLRTCAHWTHLKESRRALTPLAKAASSSQTTTCCPCTGRHTLSHRIGRVSV